MSMDWLWRQRGKPDVASLLPGIYAIPVLHSHQSLCVERRFRTAAKNTGFLTSVTSQVSYPEALLP